MDPEFGITLQPPPSPRHLNRALLQTCLGLEYVRMAQFWIGKVMMMQGDEDVGRTFCEYGLVYRHARSYSCMKLKLIRPIDLVWAVGNRNSDMRQAESMNRYKMKCIVY